MESVEHYYNSRIRLFLSCALLLTWEFFGKQIKPDIDFEYLNISIATEAIPFLLSMLILFNTYSFSLHFKIFDDTKKIKLSVFDYYLTLTVSLFSLIINFLYLIKHSKSAVFLLVTLEPLLYLFLILTDLKFIYSFKRKNPSYKPSLLIAISWIALIVLSILLIYTILTLRKQNYLNIGENIYFYSFNIIVIVFFEWAFIPKKTKI